MDRVFSVGPQTSAWAAPGTPPWVATQAFTCDSLSGGFGIDSIARMPFSGQSQVSRAPKHAMSRRNLWWQGAYRQG